MSPSTTNTESVGHEKGREAGGLLTLIWFPLLSQFSGGLDSTLAAILFQIFVRHDFTTNKFVLEIGTGQISGEARSDGNSATY